MDTTLTFAPKTVAAIPYMAEREPPRDNKVPVVKGFEGAATLPANKPFVAQVVTARLSGTEFPENPGEITPSDRTLRPYGTPMLPYENKEQPQTEPALAQDTVSSATQVATTETPPSKDNGDFAVADSVNESAEVREPAIGDDQA